MIVATVIGSSFMMAFLQLDSPAIFVLILPMIVTGLFAAINEGYLNGKLAFTSVAKIMLTETGVRLLLTAGLGFFDFEEVLALAVPIASAVTLYVSTQLTKRGNDNLDQMKSFRLPIGFLVLAFLGRISTVAFFSFDNLIVVHFYDLETAGIYALLGILGKMMYFAASLLTFFMLPLVTHRLARRQQPEFVFNLLMSLTLIVSGTLFLIFGFGLPKVAPIMFGIKMNAIAPFIQTYSLGVLAFVISQAIVQYHLARKQYLFGVVSFIIVMFQMGLLWFWHSTLGQLVTNIAIVNCLNLAFLSLFHFRYHFFESRLKFVDDVLDLFQPSPFKRHVLKDTYRILIYNWRDKRHSWAGGAELYIQEIADRLVAQGHQVTLFCGNDGQSPRNETVNGINIVRRGGFYTVYVWGFLYYLFQFRKSTDVVIDCENGIPFLTPLYVAQPVFLVVHHVHQNVFRRHLVFPMSEIAALIEGDLMTFFYRHTPVITTSASTKREIINLGLGDHDSIEIVNPGIELGLFKKRRKTKFPSIVYVGRLKAYKNVDIAVKAFAKIVKKFPDAQFTIAGSGESEADLGKLVKKLKLTGKVTLLGKVTEAEKARLLGQSWVAVQPSMVEGWGITVIEANACATPVIASDVHGLRDSVVDQETGILVPARNVRAMAKAMNELLGNKKHRRSLSTAAYVWSSRFSWDASAELFSDIIEKKLRIAALHSPKPGLTRHSRLRHES
jgi:glycosyltransferase involved in cell wall biosynthesis